MPPDTVHVGRAAGSRRDGLRQVERNHVVAGIGQRGDRAERPLAQPKDIKMNPEPKVMGNAGVADPKQMQSEYETILLPSESVDQAYQLFRDVFLFTDKRLVLVDKQGVTGKKVEYLSLPYRSMVRFSIETAGTFDMDAELKVWMSGTAEPIKKTFNKKLDVYEVQRVLAEHLL